MVSRVSNSIRGDLNGALVGALATLPQAVAYGLIAVAPLGADWAVFGITASVGSAILYGILSGLFSSNPFLVSGPRAVTALVLATAIHEVQMRGLSAESAIVIAFCAVVFGGFFQGLAGFMKLGHLVSHIPVPVISGFVNASALIVFFSSIPMVLGLADSTLVEIVMTQGAGLNVWALAVGGLTIAATFLLDGRIRLFPAALSGLILGAMAYHLGGVYLDMPLGPEVGMISLADLLGSAVLIMNATSFDLILAHWDIPVLAGLSIALLVSFDTALTSSALDDKTQGHSCANRDLKVHGALNMVMGCLGFLPGSGALSRSSAILKAGAVSRLSNVAQGILFFLLLMILAPLVAKLPLWATSGMLIATAIQALDRSTLDKVGGIFLKRVPYPRVLAGDVVVMFTVVITALAFDLIAAVGVGIVLAIALFVFGMGRDPVRRVYSCAHFRSKLVRSEQQMQVLAQEGHRVAVIEVQGALFFGACNRLQVCVDDLIDKGAQYIILDIRHLTSIDSTGSALLRRIHLKCAENGGRFYISCLEPERRFNVRGEPIEGQQRRNQNSTPRWIWLNLQANGVIKTLGAQRIFDDTDSAIAMCEEKILSRKGRSVQGDYPGRIVSSALFADLDRLQVIELSKFIQKYRFREGDVVFQQDDIGDRAYFLANGRMDVLIDIPGSSRKKRVSVLSEGTLFGEMGLIDGGPRSATVKALQTSTCFSIDRNGFEDLQRTNPSIALILMRNMSRQFAGRLRIANHMISELEQ